MPGLRKRTQRRLAYLPAHFPICPITSINHFPVVRMQLEEKTKELPTAATKARKQSGKIGKEIQLTLKGKHTLAHIYTYI